MSAPTGWELEGEYHPDRYALESTDKKGHSDVMRIRVPQGMAGRVSALLADPRLPYRSASDFIRDAIWHRAYYLSSRLQDYPELSKAALVEIAEGEILRLQRENDSLESLVTAAESALWKARERRDPFLVHSVLGEIEERIDIVREPYKTRLMELAGRARDLLR